MTGRLIRFPQRVSPDDGYSGARRILDVPRGERIARAIDLALEEPEVLLSLCSCVRELIDTSPTVGREEAVFFYKYVQVPERRVGLFDERDYFLGEFALLAGAACRHLSLGGEARLWFDRAEASFRHCVNSVADLSRLAYQRLALRLAEREIDAVLELAPALIETMQKLGMRQEELKARFLEGLALMESDRLAEAVELFQDVCRIGAELRSERLVAEGYVNLTHLYGMMGDSSNAIACSQKAIPVLNRLNDRIGLAKVQWALAVLLRERGQLEASIETYAAAQSTFEAIGMRADVAALHLVIADLHLEREREEDALRAVLAALPVIDALGMVPEGMAAMALLRESVAQQRINRNALRDVHGYFDELVSR